MIADAPDKRNPYDDAPLGDAIAKDEQAGKRVDCALADRGFGTVRGTPRCVSTTSVTRSYAPGTGLAGRGHARAQAPATACATDSNGASPGSTLKEGRTTTPASRFSLRGICRRNLGIAVSQPILLARADVVSPSPGSETHRHSRPHARPSSQVTGTPS